MTKKQDSKHSSRFVVCYTQNKRTYIVCIAPEAYPNPKTMWFASKAVAVPKQEVFTQWETLHPQEDGSFPSRIESKKGIEIYSFFEERHIDDVLHKARQLLPEKLRKGNKQCWRDAFEICRVETLPRKTGEEAELIPIEESSTVLPNRAH